MLKIKQVEKLENTLINDIKNIESIIIHKTKEYGLKTDNEYIKVCKLYEALIAYKHTIIFKLN